MSLGDRHLKDNAIAFRADWWGNYTTQLGFFDDNSKANGDLRKLTAYAYTIPTTPFPAQVPIRMTRPEQGQITSASLFLSLTAPSNGGLGVRVCGGRLASDGVTVDTSYFSVPQIAADWLKISGRSTSLTCAANGTIVLDGLNIGSLIPNRGDTNFNADGFVLCVVFDTAPNVDGNGPLGYKVTKFNVPCLVQLAVL